MLVTIRGQRVNSINARLLDGINYQYIILQIMVSS